MRDRLYRVEAIILKRTDIGEADRLLTLYTPDRGKLRAVAKGARKPSSRKTGHVELFNHVTLLVAAGRQMDVITQADTLEAFLPIRSDLERLSYAYYFAELVDRFTEEGEENWALYDLILRAFRSLERTVPVTRTAHEDARKPSEAVEQLSLLSHYFEFRLLDALGYRPQLYHCVNCGEELQAEENFFSAEGGGMLNPKCRASHRDARTTPLNALKVLRYLQSRDYAQLEQLRLSAQAQTDVEEILRFYLTHLLERNLKSIEFLNTLKLTTPTPIAEVPR